MLLIVPLPGLSVNEPAGDIVTVPVPVGDSVTFLLGGLSVTVLLASNVVNSPEALPAPPIGPTKPWPAQTFLAKLAPPSQRSCPVSPDPFVASAVPVISTTPLAVMLVNVPVLLDTLPIGPWKLPA